MQSEIKYQHPDCRGERLHIMKSTEVLNEVNAFMSEMRDGNFKGVVANLQAAMEYQAEELRIYRERYKEATGKERPELSDDEKRRLARKGRVLNSQLLSIVDASWAPGTVLGWYRTLIAGKYTSTGPNQKKRGRQPVSEELASLIVRLGENNPGWGYKRIRSYLLYLGYKASFMTVKRVLNKHGIYPPEDGRSNSDWELFFNSHQDVIASCDFASYELVTPSGLVREHILFFENITTREVWLGGIAHEPDANWTAQIARNQIDMWDGKLTKMRYLIHDRDPLFLGRFTDILKSAGCQTKLIPPRSPECNGFIESFIKTIKTECLDQLILSTEAQLRYAVTEFIAYYNRERPHSALGGKMINPLPQDSDGEIIEFSRLGGLLKSYRRVKAAA